VSEPALPEDLSRWPTDPFELLGATRETPPKDVKRAYTRLIRVYKPEQYPEHFRRIREAYESVLRYVELFGGMEVLPTPTPETPAPEPAADAPVFTGPRPLPVPNDELHDLWQQAIRGEEAEAYRGLLRLHGERPHNATICLRLYWLLTLAPDLDRQRRPCAWLAAALMAAGLNGPALELYRREIDADPEEAFSSHFEELLELDAATSARAELYAWRWAAARRLKRYSAVADDLPRAKERVGRFDEDAWLRLVLTAADVAAWLPEGQTYAELWHEVAAEVQHLSHLGSRFAAWFDRFDYLLAVRADYQKMCGATEALAGVRDLVAAAWHAPLPSYRADFFELLSRIVADPVGWLGRLDDVARSAPAVLSAFGELLHLAEQRAEMPPRPGPATLAKLAVAFLDGLALPEVSVRDHTVRFCTREMIEPMWLLETFSERQVEWNSPVDPEAFVRIQGDWPARYVCLANRIFWAR
jgi:hypothetical protein